MFTVTMGSSTGTVVRTRTTAVLGVDEVTCVETLLSGTRVPSPCRTSALVHREETSVPGSIATPITTSRLRPINGVPLTPAKLNADVVVGTRTKAATTTAGKVTRNLMRADSVTRFALDELQLNRNARAVKYALQTGVASLRQLAVQCDKLSSVGQLMGLNVECTRTLRASFNGRT